MSRCCVANLTRMLQTSSFNQTHVLVASNRFFFLLPNPNPLLNPFPVLIILLNPLPDLPVLVALKILREILLFTRSLMINTHPLNSVLYLGLLQVVLFTVRRYIGLIECVWFCNVTPDLYRETVTQHTLLLPSGLARMAFKSS